MLGVRVKTQHSVVLLSAGSGSRMGALTSNKPKSLLSVGDKTVLDWMLEAIVSRTGAEVIVVTGFQADKVEQHLAKHYGNRIKTVRNPFYSDDINILSVETGVSALSHPEHGYLIIETDLLLDEKAWDKIFFTELHSNSYWVCKGRYHQQLTGGIVQVDIAGSVQAIDYQPNYNVAYDGWAKMVGMLHVGPAEVKADRQLRQAAISHNIKQYYLMPWRENLQYLPCYALDLADSFAYSFNTEADFRFAAQAFLTLMSQNMSTPKCR